MDSKEDLTKTIEELVKTNEELKKKLETLSVPYEDALANRVFEKNQDKFKKWFGTWVVFLTLAVTLIGLKGYDSAITAAETQANVYVANQANKVVENRVDRETKALIDKANEKLNKELDNFKNKASENLNQITAAVDTIKADAELKLGDKGGTKVLQGFVATSFFKKISGSSEQTFAKDDVLTATANVNLRNGNPNNTSDFLSWAIVRTISKGTRVKVLQTVPSSSQQSLDIAQVEVLP